MMAELRGRTGENRYCNPLAVKIKDHIGTIAVSGMDLRFVISFMLSNSHIRAVYM